MAYETITDVTGTAVADADVRSRGSDGRPRGRLLPAAALRRAGHPAFRRSGVPPGDVVIIGGGIVGLNAAKIALGLGASVTILETNHRPHALLDNIFGGGRTLASNHHNLSGGLRRADVLVGAVLIPGASAPKLVTARMLRR